MFSKNCQTFSTGAATSNSFLISIGSLSWYLRQGPARTPERLMIGGEQGVEVRVRAGEDLAGTGVLRGVHWLCLFLVGRAVEAPAPASLGRRHDGAAAGADRREARRQLSAGGSGGR